ncbi:hypothetical protein GCM10022232_85920 [Streptomyces plumbiresistens]|uniref:Uncharacterized protein n=1 Tax=Streptomyces plumbiresistens TaxID=511811 RepID=A0ABP7TJM7_9ACTN
MSRGRERKPDKGAVSSSLLRDKRFNGYLRLALPHPLDAEVEAVVRAYLDGSASVRENLVNGLSGQPAAVLSAYGQRMASVAVRTGSVEALRRGIVAIGLAEGRLDDPRDNLFVLAAANDSASLIGTSLGRVIDDIQDALPPVGLRALRAFEGYRESDKSIEAMGIRRSGAGPDFLYV